MPRVKILNKILFSMVGISALSALLILVVGVKIETSSIEQSLINENMELAEISAKTIESGYFVRVWPLETLKLLSQSKNVLFWWVVKPDGEIFFADDPESFGKTIDKSFLESSDPAIRDSIYYKTKEKIKLISYPVNIGINETWQFFLGVSSKSITDAQGRMILINTGFLLIAICLEALLSFFVSRSITSPIRKLRESALMLAKGEFRKTDIKSNDETGELAEAFNNMIDDVKESREALEEAKTTLEIKVRARTKELQESAESLNERVKERTKELQQKIEELERFNKLTVGRELKMVELKEQVERFKKALQEKKE